MKAALLIAALLSAVNPPANVDRTCRCCDGRGIEIGWLWRGWNTLPDMTFSDCERCGGYGKERTIYGRLLKEKR